MDRNGGQAGIGACLSLDDPRVNPEGRAQMGAVAAWMIPCAIETGRVSMPWWSPVTVITVAGPAPSSRRAAKSSHRLVPSSSDTSSCSKMKNLGLGVL